MWRRGRRAGGLYTGHRPGRGGPGSPWGPASSRRPSPPLPSLCPFSLISSLSALPPDPHRPRCWASTPGSGRPFSMPSCAGACPPRTPSTPTGWCGTFVGRARRSLGKGAEVLLGAGLPIPEQAGSGWARRAVFLPGFGSLGNSQPSGVWVARVQPWAGLLCRKPWPAAPARAAGGEGSVKDWGYPAEGWPGRSPAWRWPLCLPGAAPSRPGWEAGHG